MSRSYKKTWGFKDHSKSMKRLANKRVRHAKGLSEKGSSFKKVFESYDISDWKYLIYSKKEQEEIKENKDGFYTNWWQWKFK